MEREIDELLAATEEKIRAEVHRAEREQEHISRLHELAEKIGGIYDLITACQMRTGGGKLNEIWEKTMSDEKESLKRVHVRIDKIDSTLAEVIQRLATVEASRGYIDKAVDKTEERHYSAREKILPYIGILMGLGAMAVALLSGHWGKIFGN